MYVKFLRQFGKLKTIRNKPDLHGYAVIDFYN